MKKKTYNIIVNVNLEYKVKAKNESEAIEIVENTELPKEYISDSFYVVKVIREFKHVNNKKGSF